MKIYFSANYNGKNIKGYTLKKEHEFSSDAIRRSLERRIKKGIYSLNRDHRNSDGSVQASGVVVKYNRHADCYDNLGTITVLY